MTDYGWARPDEEDQLIDFANYVFSLDGAPTDFKLFHPRIYDRPGSSSVTQVAREGGSIKGMISAVTGYLQAGEHQLKYGFIGSVSVHPYFRGRGYMKQLMPMTMDALKQQGCQFVALGGQRQRYQHFGFEDAGGVLTLHLTGMSLRHTLGPHEDKAFSFVPLEQAGQEALEHSFRLHEARDLRSLRPKEDFAVYLKSWKGQAYAIYHDGQYAGYFYLVGDRIAEHGLVKEEKLRHAVYAFMRNQQRDYISLSILPVQAQRYAALFEAADSWQIKPALNLLVLDWAAFIQGLLQYKARYLPLVDGRAVLGIQDEGHFAIAVKAGQVLVEKTQEQADITLDSMAALRLTTLPFADGLYPGHPFHNWFPLPFMLLEADAF